jgi:hypothetical protein
MALTVPALLRRKDIALSWIAKAAATLSNSPSIGGAILNVNLDGEEVYPLADPLNRRCIPFVFSTGYGEEKCQSVLGSTTCRQTLPSERRRAGTDEG